MNARVRNALTFALAFSGGFVIMSIELLGGKIMAPWFGGSIHVWGSIITVFMLALSLGYLIGGRLSVQSPSLRRFALIFLLASTLLVPLVLAGDLLMEWVFLRVEDPRWGSLLAACLLFGLPTVVLGMIAPYSVRLLVTNTVTSGQVAGRLYFVSTLGSALGTLATSFWLVAVWPSDTILWVLGGWLALGGTAALLLDPLLPALPAGQPGPAVDAAVAK